MFDVFFAIVFIVGGVYVLYAARELKQAHRIITTVISVPEGKTCKDMDGLVRYMFPRLMLLACATCMLGVLELFLSLQEESQAFSTMEVVLVLAFFGILIYYYMCVRKLEKLFY